MAKNTNPVVTFETLAKSIEAGHGGETRYLGDAMNDALIRVVVAAIKSGAKSALTLKLTVKPIGDGEVAIGAEIGTKCPEPGAFPIRVFADKSGRLLSEDPAQGKLPVSIVQGGEEE